MPLKTPPSQVSKINCDGLCGARRIMNKSRGPKKKEKDHTPKKEKEHAFFDPEGETITNKEKKEKRENKKYITITSLYRNWRDLMARHIGMVLPSDEEIGRDRGHIRNLLDFFGGYDKTFEAMQTFISRWKDFQKKFPIAKHKDVPDLYLADTLKHDILAVMNGLSSLTVVPSAVHRSDNQKNLVTASAEDVAKHFFNRDESENK